MWANIQPLHQLIKASAYNQVFLGKTFQVIIYIAFKKHSAKPHSDESEEFQDNSCSHAKIPIIEHSGTMVLAMYTS